jgi:Cu-Zn family superoxide dismutase
MNRSCRLALCASLLLTAASPALAATLKAEMFLATAQGKAASVGTVTVSDSKKGARFRVKLHGLPPGQHGFHVHDKGSCDPATAADGKITPAGGAGGHMDPAMTGKHMGPEGMGHLGDLPALTVDAKGASKQTLTAPHVTDATQLKGHALMIHAGGDNYADTPAALGGGGARIACGVLG